MCPQTQSPSLAPGAGTAKSPSAGGGVSHDIYQQDGDYIKDIEVNDLRNRYTLTKGSTQKMVNNRLLRPTDNLRRTSPALPFLLSILQKLLPLSSRNVRGENLAHL